MAENTARNLLILGGLGVLGYWWYTSQKEGAAEGPRTAPIPGPSIGPAPKPVATTTTVPSGGGKGSGGVPTGETTGATEREQTERVDSGYIAPPESDYRYTATEPSEPVFEDTSGYFEGTGGVDGTRGPSDYSYNGGDYGTRG